MVYSKINSWLKNGQNADFSKVPLAYSGKSEQLTKVPQAWIRIRVGPHFFYNFEAKNPRSGFAKIISYAIFLFGVT